MCNELITKQFEGNYNYNYYVGTYNSSPLQFYTALYPNSEHIDDLHYLDKNTGYIKPLDISKIQTYLYKNTVEDDSDLLDE